MARVEGERILNTVEVTVGHLTFHQAHRMTFARVTVVTQLLTSGEKVSRWRVSGQGRYYKRSSGFHLVRMTYAQVISVKD